MKLTWRKRIEALSIALVTVLVGSMAYSHEGVPAAEVDLNDGGVWLTNGERMLVGHFNYPSQTLDGGLRASATGFDVSQFGTSVVIDSPDVYQALDTASVSVIGESVLGNLDRVHGGDTVLIADSDEGNVWVLDSYGAAGFSAAVDPTLEELENPRIAVGADGTGYVVVDDGEVLRVPAGAYAGTEPESLGRLAADVPDDAQLTVAGSTLVALSGNSLITVDREITLDGLEGGVLQQTSADGRHVAIASDDALWRVQLRGDTEPVVVDVPRGAPAAPVLLDGCAFGVWAQSGYYVRDCGDPALDQAAQYPELAAAIQPVFRTNNNVIVINDIVTGAAFLPLEGMVRIDNWDIIEQQLDSEEESDETEETTEEDLSLLQEFSEEQNPPVAVDDELGARAGAATTLPVLLNDIDVDGDVLTVLLDDTPGDVTVTPAKDNRAVRVEVPDDKVGSFSFTYRAFDGVHESNLATVRVNVIREEVNRPPQLVRNNVIRVSERATAEYSVLPDWVDPDGDAMFLQNAVSQDGLSVTWRPDGFIAVRDLGSGGPGNRTVAVTVSDGVQSTTEELTVYVTPGSVNEPPVANNDHYVATVGERITIRPLSNDTDPEGHEIRLVDVGPVNPEVEVDVDYQENLLQFVASEPGTQTIVYRISDGPNDARGKIRVDVLESDDADTQIAAENDLALMPPTGAVIVEPLANDFDPSGGVLVLQGISMGDANQLTVEVIQHSLLRVTAPTGLDEAQSFEYSVSNGMTSATATVLVVPMAGASDLQPPVALPDDTVVRAGDIVSLDVLTNDYSPSGLDIRLLPDLDVGSDGDLGEFFVSDDKVRFKAGDKPGTASAIYTIQDSEGNIASNTVTVSIRDFDDRNQQPMPHAVEARTFSGMTVRIPIPMDGVDPDGDSVELVGLGETSPRLGSVSVEGNYLEYTAGRDGVGTDTFSYVVQDRFGAQGEALVRVGVAPAPQTNQPPIAVPDEIAARPNTHLEIPVLENDIDPDGDDIFLVPDSIEPANDRWDPEVDIHGQRIVVETPAEEGVYQLYYSVTDRRSNPVVGVVTVTVDADVAPIAPIARDDYIPASSIQGLESVDVDVLANDIDPDGVVSDLVVTVEEPATVQGGTVTVPLAADRQIILYTITDPDGLTAQAAIVVPSKDQVPPHLNPDLVPTVIKGGETLTIDFAEYVVTRPDHRAILTSVNSVTTGPGGHTEMDNGGLEIVSDTAIQFTPDTLFIGSTSVSFHVTDGDSVDDPRGMRASLSLPIEVESSGLFPPELRPSEITISPGEEPLQSSLSVMVDDPDPGDNEIMTYTIMSVTEPFEVTIEGQDAYVAVAPNVPVGTAGEMVVEVHDGSTDPLPMTVPLRVASSTRPLMSTTTYEDNEGRVGEPIVINLEDWVTNPFADRDGEITLIGEPEVVGSATLDVSGLQLTVTPQDSGDINDTVERVLVHYMVADATLDESRYQSGSIDITVKGVPRAPYNVTASHEGSMTARVNWEHVGWRGGEPVGYTVYWAGGSQECSLQTYCDIVDIPNNNEYQFTVTARVAESDIADSEASEPSNVIFVDVLPDTPTAPIARFGDQEIDLEWEPVAVPDGGSPVTGYTIDITPADAAGRTQIQTSATEMTWTNLSNGVPYTFTVTAHNQLTSRDHLVEAPTGPRSPAEIPAGAPSLVRAPVVTMDSPRGAGTTGRVAWDVPGNSNGDTSFRYELRETRGSTVYQGQSRASDVTMAVSTTDKTFEVRATNKSGLWSEWSPVSNAVRAFEAPGQPGSFSLTATGSNNQVRFNFNHATGNGTSRSEITYHWTANGQSGTVSPGGTVTNSSAFRNGTSTRVTLTARATVGNRTADGNSVSATVTTYGPPADPSVSANPSGNQVRLEWSVPATSNGASTTVSTRIYNATNGNTIATRTSRSGTYTTSTVRPDQLVRIETTVTTDGGSKTSTAQVRTPPPPPPPPPPTTTPPPTTNPPPPPPVGSGSFSGLYDALGMCVDLPEQRGYNVCFMLTVSVSGWGAHRDVTCTWTDSDGRGRSVTVRTNGSGSGSSGGGQLNPLQAFHLRGLSPSCRY